MARLDTGVNVETGEIGFFVPANEGYVVRTQAEIDATRRYFERERMIDAGRRVDFTFTAMEAIAEVISALSTAQCGYLLVLQCYIEYRTNAIVTPSGNPMTSAEMMSALKLADKRSTFYAFLSACQDNGIITKDDAGRYVINPRYHFRGPVKDRAVIRNYTAKIRQTYKSDKQAANFGLVYRMLPFVNYETNALCSNPTERDPYKVDWFTGKELALAIGITESELSRRIKRLTIGDEYVIARISVGGTAKYMFNPQIFKRNNRPVDDSIQAMFNVKYRKRK